METPRVPGFVVVSSFGPLHRLEPLDEAGVQALDQAGERAFFDFEASVLNLNSVEKIQNILGLDESSVVDFKLAQVYFENSKRELGARISSNDSNEAEASVPPSKKAEVLKTPGADIEADESVWPFEQTTLDFSLPSTEIRKRAAWAWRRSALLCERQADAAHDEEVAVRSSIDVEQMRQIMADSLRTRARKAMDFAISLDPESATEDVVKIPDWADAWRDEDSEFYEEMAGNYKMQQYATATERYKRAGHSYIMKAFGTYVTDKHYVELGKTKEAPKNEEQLFAEAICSAGSLVRLWSQAAEWSVTPGPLPPRMQFSGGRPIIPRDARDDFREWWHRAAFATGHTFSLDEELTEIIFSREEKWLRRLREPSNADILEDQDEVDEQVESSLKRWNDFRMQWPPSIEDYETDSIVRTKWWMWLWIGEYGEDQYDMDDPYMTLYNCMYTDHNDLLSRQTGVEPPCFVYGCPDTVFSERGKSGWNADYLGLLGECVEPKEALYERYQRKGLLDWISGSLEYEKLLAICADDIVVRIGQDTRLPVVFADICQKAGLPPEEFSCLKQKLKLMVTRRGAMTHAAAKQHGFAKTVYEMISNFVERLVNSNYFRDMGAPVPAIIPQAQTVLIYLERVLNDTVTPYLRVSFRMLPNGYPFAFIFPDYLFDSTLRPLYSASKSLSQYAEWIHAISLDLQIKQFRERLKDTGAISPSDMPFALLFKETLISGDTEMLPKVTTGLFEYRQRGLPLFAVMEKHHFECPPNCSCQRDALNESPDAEDEYYKALSSEQRKDIDNFNEMKRTWREHQLTEEEKELCKQFVRVLRDI